MSFVEMTILCGVAVFSIYAAVFTLLEVVR